MNYLDMCITSIDAISKEENAALYYIAGYVQHKFGPYVSVSDALFNESSEFTELVSRGRLCHPSEHIFQFVRYAYSLYNLLPNVEIRFKCVRYIVKLFTYLYNALPLDLQLSSINEVIRTIVNCFFKGITKLEDSSENVSRSIDERKIKKLSGQ